MRLRDFAELRHVSQYTAPLAIHGPSLRMLLDRVDALESSDHRAAVVARIEEGDIGPAEPSTSIDENGVATLNVRGILTKYGSSLSGAGSLVKMKRIVENWMIDESVRAMMLVVDSPGGTVAGTVDLADAVAAFTAVKPCVAYIDDLGASAGYWIPAQAGRVFAGRAAQIGSIGCYCVLVDSSAKSAKAGVKVHVLRSAAFKGVGEDGAEITEEQIAAAQETPQKIHSMFVEAIAAGRGMTTDAVEAFADGRVYMADEALGLGMIDGVCSLAEAYRYLTDGAEPPAATSTNGEDEMAYSAKAAAKAPHKLNVPAPTAPAAPQPPAPAAPAAPPAAEDPAVPVVPPEEEEEEEEEEAVPPVVDAAPAAAPPAAPAPAPVKPAAASVAQIRKVYPEASDAFIVQCVAAGRSVEQVKDAAFAALRAQVSARGVHPMHLAAGVGGAPVASLRDEFERRVSALMATGLPRNAAVSSVVKADPGLQAALRDEANARR